MLVCYPSPFRSQEDFYPSAIPSQLIYNPSLPGKTTKVKIVSTNFSYSLDESIESCIESIVNHVDFNVSNMYAHMDELECKMESELKKLKKKCKKNNK
jgi:hypothetical protein